MKILVLNGSPRKNGNTAAMVDAFKEGAAGNGHEVNVIRVYDKKIGACLACEYCHEKSDGICVQKDDMQEIYEAMKETDMLVLASPVHYWYLSAPLQAAITRFYSVNEDIMSGIKKTAMLLSSGSPGVYDAIIKAYNDSFIDYLGFEDMGVITAYEDQNQSPEKLAECKAFGASL